MLTEKKSPLTGRKVEALRTLIQYQTGNKNIEIIHSPNADLKTDGKRIWLPWISDDVFEEYAGLLHAGLLHEGAHIKRSDFPILRDKKAIPNMLVKGFANAIEDSRIERYESQQYSSLKLEFTRFNEFYKRDYIKTKQDHEKKILTDPSHFFFLVSYCVDLYLADYEYDYLPESVIATFNQIKDIVDDYRAKEIDGPKGSLIAVAAANDIYKRLKDLFASLPEVSTSGEGEPDEKEKDSKEDKKDKKRKQSSDKRRSDDEGKDNDDDTEEGDNVDGEDGSGSDNNDDDDTEKDSEHEENGEDEEAEGTKSEGKGNSSKDDDEGDEGKEGNEGDEETGKRTDSTEKESDKESLSGTPIGDDDGDEGDDDDEEDGLPSLEDFDKKVDGDEPTTETEHCGSVELKEKEKGSKKNPKDITSAMEKAIKAAAERGTTLDFTRLASCGGEDEGGGGDFLNPSKMLDMAKDAGIKTIREQFYEALREEIVEKESSGPTQHMPHPLAMARDVVFTPNISATTPQKQFYAELREELAPEIGRLKSQLLSLIMSQKRVHFAPDSEEGEIDTAALHSLRHGNKRIFSSHTWGRDLNTAIEVLVDCSGSMGSDGKAMGAMKAAIALSEVLAILNIPFEVTGYTTDARRITVPAEEDNIYNRIEGLIHFVFKAFEENFGTVKYRLLSIRAQNNNCDGESVMWAAQRLFRRKEKRKILFVFSDGMPACYSSNHMVLESDLKETVKKIEKMGAEVYGIGIYTDAPRHFYTEYSEITRYADKSIASAIFECLKKKLSQGVSTTGV